MSKHTKTELMQMQALPTDIKVKMTQRRVREWYEHFDGMVYVSFSGGKDSTVLKHIVDQMYDDVPSVFVNTGLEYPEVQRFVYEIKDGKYPGLNPNVHIEYPKKKFKQVLEDYGYPVISKEVAKNVYYARSKPGGIHYQKLFWTYVDKGTGELSEYNCEKYKHLYDAPFKISDYCCNVMKKGPAKKYSKCTGRTAIVATMCEESRQRQSTWMKQGCNAFDNRTPKSTPMSFWTEQDVLRYIREHGLHLASVYGDVVETPCQTTMFDETVPALALTGVNRTGCMFCMFGVHLEGHPNRFERMKTEHPKHYEYIMKDVERGGCGCDKVLSWLGIEH